MPSLIPEDLSHDKLLATLKRDGEGRPQLGDYSLLRRIGVGGMGAVYYGIHPRLKREVAIKILPFHLVEQEPTIVKRFQAEARMAAALESDNVVPVIDVGEEGGTHYFVMQFISGESAGALLKRLKAAGKPGVPERDAIDIITAAARGLALAHQKGIIHRDVKPDNILIPTGKLTRAKIADLGLAKPEASGHTFGTMSHVAMGTPGYMAPEQAEDARSAGPPADVFALGATFYALLAGRAPFTGPSLMAVMRAAAEDEPPPLPKSVSPAVANLIGRCMEKDPADRYPDCIALLAALERVAADPVGGETPSSRKPGAPKRIFKVPGPAPRPPGRGNLWIGLAAAAAVLGVAVIGVVMSQRRDPDVAATPGRTPDDPERNSKEEREKAARAARDEKIVEALKNVELLEAGGKLEEAHAQTNEALKLDADNARAKELRARIEQKLVEAKRNAALRGTYRAAVDTANRLTREAEARGSSEAWGAVVEAVKAAEAAATTDDERRSCRGAVARCSAQRAWAMARESEAAGNVDEALAHVATAIDCAGTTAALSAYKAGLEKKRREAARKKDYDETVAAAAAEKDPMKALDLWKQAKELADAPKDRDAAQARIDTLTAGLSAAELEKRYQEAMKAGDAALAGSQFDEAAANYKEALTLRANDAAAKASLARVDAGRMQKLYDAAMAEAKAADQNRWWAEAKAAYEKALAAKPGDAAAKKGAAESEKNRKSSRRSIPLDADGRIKMEFVLVKAGMFTMGDKRGDSNAAPHEVTLTRDFWMAATETTQLQWEALMGKDKNISFHKGADLPVENVSYDDAGQFVKKLNARFKAELATLPSEAEWEYAYKANQKTIWPGGDEAEKSFDSLWCENNSGGESKPVAQKKPNPWGLHDLGGNVWEWQIDGLREYKGKCADPLGITTGGEDRSIRGGSGFDHPGNGRFSQRGQAKVWSREKHIGFRVVLH